MAQMPNQYYDRTDPAKNYEQHLFIAGRGLQSAELNEIQRTAQNRLRGIADSIFKDGDVVRDASIIVNQDTGLVQCQSGAVYIRGAVRGVAPASFTIPIVGEYAIGIRLFESVVTALQDPDLLDPATGTRYYNQPGAERLRVDTSWGWSGDGQAGEFFPVYSVLDGVLSAKEAPPVLDAVTQALARYDRDSAGGTYVVSGLNVTKLPDAAGLQVYSVAQGRARVFGYGVDLQTSLRVTLGAVADLKVINNEPHLSASAGAQRVNFDRTPGTLITEVSITAEKTVTLTHGVFTGATDPLPDTSVLSVLEVKQGVTTYVSGADYNFVAGSIDWSPGGNEPAPGSTYTVKYRYITNVTPTAVDDKGFTVTGAVTGTLILVSYSQKLPRYDRLCINTEGQPVWVLGVAAEFNPQPPSIPPDLLLIATVYQTWVDATRTVSNDGVRVVPMPQLASVEGRLDWIVQLLAQQRLESDVHTRETGVKKGLFTDPFIDNSHRDAGTPQTAAVVNGELILPIASTVRQMPSDVQGPTTLLYSSTIILSQDLRSGFMKINPYMAFDVPAANVTLTPAVDRWADLVTTWASPDTRFWFQWGWVPGNIATQRDVLLSRTVTEVQFLRQIQIAYTVSGFGPGEQLQSLVFDGVAITQPTLTANASGVISGTFTIPANIPTGAKLVTVTGQGGSRGSATFIGQGTITRDVLQRQVARRTDPLAQTFTLLANTMLSAVDLWFTDKPTTPLTVQIRETATGFPASTIIAEITVQPAAIQIGGASTRINFASPVPLLANVEYAMVVLCNDAVGAVSVAELGKFDANQQRWITSQPYTVGVLLSSSNASTWTAHQDRDMAFRLLAASFTQTSRSINMGNVPVTGATDLVLLSFADRPSSASNVEYDLTLPDGAVLTVAESQPVQLSSAITGNVGVVAKLSGDAVSSPILFPGTQLIAGAMANTGDYVSRAVPAGINSAVKVIFEAVIPSGATVSVFCKGPDAGDTWISMPQTATKPADDGFVEFTHSLPDVDELTLQFKLVLNGTPAARPRIRDLRAIVQ